MHVVPTMFPLDVPIGELKIARALSASAMARVLNLSGEALAAVKFCNVLQPISMKPRNERRKKLIM